MTEAALLAELPLLAFQAVLLLARLGAACMILPGLGEQDVPAPIRLALALALVVLLLPVLRPVLPAAPDAAVEAARLIALEVVVGLWLAGLARILALGFAIAGQAIALLVGLSSALVPDPQFGQQTAITARLAALLGALFILSSGLYALPLGALARSYGAFPPGAPWPAGEAAEAVAIAAGQSLDLALRLAAPFVFGAVLLNVSLGLLARLAPQIQVYFVAIPGQVLAGIALLAVLIAPMLALFAETMATLFAALPGTP